MNKPKILLWDIETLPRVVTVWEHYEQNVLWCIKEWQLLSFAWKWFGDPKINVMSLRTVSEAQLVAELWGLMDSADFTVAHNGDKFDIKKARTKFIEYKHNPFEPSHTVDTLKIAKAHFSFPSNKLDDLCAYLGIGRKVNTGGVSLWRECFEGNIKSLNKMETYNKHDVRLLEGLYKRISPWVYNQPKISIISGQREQCPNPACGSMNTHRNGFKYTAAQGKKVKMQCQDCFKWFLVKEKR